ncbi:MAG TPA: tetratricopeptide repeat protein [Bacteroidota bacterium]|nr:tetratricopeptide repeat protein [Bacteroidota bacterium]
MKSLPASAACWIVILTASALPSAATAQSVRSLVNGGNDFYKEEKYPDAEVNYRKALAKEKDLVQGHFNLGDALGKEGKFGEAVTEYQNALTKAERNDTKAFAHYNIGNAMLKQQRYPEAVQSYVNALKLNPRDEDAKYNLSYALEKMRQPPQQQKKNDKNDKNKQKQDQQKQNQQKQDQKNQQDKQQPPPQQQQKQMSKADAQRILDVLKNNEKEVQKKLHTRPAARARTDKDW